MKLFSNNKQSYLLSIILIIAAILRLRNIDQPFVDAFDWRQTSTAMMAENYYRTNSNIFYPQVNWGGAGPSYQGREFQTVSYLAAMLYHLVGQQDWVGRSVAIIFGLWGIFALYQLVRRVWTEQYALAAAAMMALLPGSIFTDRSFLPDPAMVALVVTSFWMWVAYLQSDRPQDLRWAAGFGIWGFLTKLPGLIVGIPMLYAMFAILNARQQQTPKKLITIAITATLVLTPVVAYYLWARHLSLTHPPYHFAGEDNWLWDNNWQEWISQGYFLQKLYWLLNHWLLTKPIMLLVGMGLLLAPPTSKQAFLHTQECGDGQPPHQQAIPKAPWVFHWWLLAGFFLYYLIGAYELVENPWNLHVFHPAVAALAGRAVVKVAIVARKINRSAALASIATMLLIVAGVGQHHLTAMYFPSWTSPVNYHMGLALRQITRPDDLVVTIPYYILEPVAIYYSHRRGWSLSPDPIDAEKPEEGIAADLEVIQEFEAMRQQGADWLAIADSRKEKIWQDYPEFAQYVQQTCRVVQQTAEWSIYQILPLAQPVSQTVIR